MEQKQTQSVDINIRKTAVLEIICPRVDTPKSKPIAIQLNTLKLNHELISHQKGEMKPG
jgi:hypothetical protein